VSLQERVQKLKAAMGKLDEDLLVEGQVLEGRWTVRRKLGGGGFGQVFAVMDKKMERELAIKVEPRGRKEVLPIEAGVLEDLKGKPHCPPFFGIGGNARVNFLVMEILGKNLSDLRRESPGDKTAFSQRTGFLLALQGLEALEDMHRNGHLHRDVKPSNYVMGLPATAYRRTVFLIDFGLSRKIYTASGQLREARPPGGFRGTVKYAAPNAHDGLDLGRKDDLVSLFYMTLEMVTGSLPWRRLRDKKDVGVCKKTTPLAKLCEGLPQELQEFGREIFKYEYETEPDYALLKRQLILMMVAAGGSRQTVLDWDDNWTHFLASQNQRDDPTGRFQRKPSALTATMGTSVAAGRTGMTRSKEKLPKPSKPHLPSSRSNLPTVNKNVGKLAPQPRG
jgi:tau tubulin kinase